MYDKMFSVCAFRTLSVARFTGPASLRAFRFVVNYRIIADWETDGACVGPPGISLSTGAPVVALPQMARYPVGPHVQSVFAHNPPGPA